MAFTTGTLFHLESVKLASLYLEYIDWVKVRAKVVDENLLQARTLNTSKRVCREIISRLKHLRRTELEFLTTGDYQEQGYLLWLAVCRRYSFIADFAIEVVRERYITLKADLNTEDYEAFFNGKTDTHPELEKVRPATRSKARQVLFKMLREASLLSADNIIQPATFSFAFLETISRESSQDFLYLPVFDSDLKGALS